MANFEIRSLELIKTFCSPVCDFAKFAGSALRFFPVHSIFSSCLFFDFAFSRFHWVMEYAQLGWRVGAVLLPGSGSGISFPRLRLYPRMPGFCRRLSISNGGVLRCVVGPVVTRCSGVYETGRSFSSPPNFRRSVLSCIVALDRESRLIFLRFREM